jgi:hypothetical protein
MSDDTLNTEYQGHMIMLWTAAEAISKMPLITILERMNRAEALGPLLDPTLWRDKSKQFQEDKRIVEAALHVARAFAEIKAEQVGVPR